MLLAAEVAATSLDLVAQAVAGLVLIVTTAVAWGTLRATVKTIVRDIQKIQEEHRRNAGDLEERVRTLENRFEREKGRNEGSRGRSHTMTDTSTFTRGKKR